MADWDPLVPYYDLLFEDRTIDILFWLTLAKKFGPPILELACGTGRIAIPIAKAGVKIYGIDISKSMLRVAREKISRETYKVCKLIKLLEGDANNFNIPKVKFRAIFATWGFMPLTKHQEKTFFYSLSKHLLPGGRIVLDLNNFKKPSENEENYSLNEYKNFPDKGFSLLRYIYHSINAEEKIGTYIYILDKIKKDGTNRRFVMSRKEKIYTINDILLLLSVNGFKVDEIYGNYDFASWNKDSERTIIIAKRKSGSKKAWRILSKYLPKNF